MQNTLGDKGVSRSKTLLVETHNKLRRTKSNFMQTVQSRW